MTVDTAKALRKAMFNANEMTSKELMDRYECTKSHVSQMRTEGVKSMEAICRLSAIFEIRPSEFIAMGE